MPISNDMSISVHHAYTSPHILSVLFLVFKCDVIDLLMLVFAPHMTFHAIFVLISRTGLNLKPISELNCLAKKNSKEMDSYCSTNKRARKTIFIRDFSAFDVLVRWMSKILRRLTLPNHVIHHNLVVTLRSQGHLMNPTGTVHPITIPTWYGI